MNVGEGVAIGVVVNAGTTIGISQIVAVAVFVEGFGVKVCEGAKGANVSIPGRDSGVHIAVLDSAA